MDIDLETTVTEGPGSLWLDVDAFTGPVKPGNARRRDPMGDFPSGPEVGARLPDVVAAVRAPG